MLVAKYYYVAYSIFFHSKQEANIGTRSTGVHSKCFSLTARRMEQTSILVNRGWALEYFFRGGGIFTLPRVARPSVGEQRTSGTWKIGTHSYVRVQLSCEVCAVRINMSLL